MCIVSLESSAILHFYRDDSEASGSLGTQAPESEAGPPEGVPSEGEAPEGGSAWGSSSAVSSPAGSGGDMKIVASVVLRPNSLVVFAGEAYTDLKHGIKSLDEQTRSSEVVPTTVINAGFSKSSLGHEITRGPRRLSLTLRRLVNVERQIEEFDVVDSELEYERARRRSWWLSSISEK